MSRAELTDAGVFGIMQRYGDLCIHAAIDLRRTFSREELERALAETIADFPVLGCRYAPGFWRDRWVPVPGPIGDSVIVEEGGDPEAWTEAWVLRSLDGTRERQIRVAALVVPGGMRMLISVMHLAVDGAGLAAVGHVFGCRLYGVAPRLEPERERHPLRSMDGIAWYHLPVLARGLARTAIQPIANLLAAPRARPYARDEQDRPRWRHVVISPDELARARERCAPGTSVNDLVVAAVARAAAARSDGGPVVVMYTMDLRRYGKAPRLRATNSSTPLSLTVSRAASGDLASAARAVSEATAKHRAGLAGPAFLLAPYALGAFAPHAIARTLVPLLAPALVDMPLERGLLVTNVGKVDDGLAAFGDDVVDLRIIGPNLRGFPVPAVVAFGFRGALHLELFASPGIAERALAELEAEIRAALEG